MATNPWVSQSVRSEQNMYEDLVIESLKFYGQDVYYLPREIVNKDKVFLDDVPSRFSDAYKIEMYIENVDAFGGEGDLFSKFGVELRDQATFVVARRRWKKLIGDKLDAYNFRPREGDLLYMPMSQSIFEIFKVETETPFYQLSQLPTFRLQCELFEYNDEDFDTDIEGIDDVEEESAYQYKLTMLPSADATASARAIMNLDGSISKFVIDDVGLGYTTAPTITIADNPGSNAKFGGGSLNVTRGRGIEGNYSDVGNHGSFEAWIYIDTLPTEGTQHIFFYTGGNDENEVAKYYWGVNENGQLVYSRGDNQGGGVTSLTASSIIFEEDTWHHILIGVDNTNEIYIYFDFEKKLYTTLAGVTFDWITNGGYSVGATAARTVDGVTWGSMNGFIDEVRVKVGDRATILEDRFTTPGNDNVIMTQEEEWATDDDTVLLEHFNPVSATATSLITSEGKLEAIEIVESGLYYDNAPVVTIQSPYTGGNYERNTIVEQNQGTFTMKGEVAKWSDSDNVLYLTHVGATDGLYHTFNTTNAVVSDDASYAPSLVEELQQIQQVETGLSQGDYFDDFENDFLDFSESNPFGDIS
jgi:hypothetical protein